MTADQDKTVRKGIGPRTAAIVREALRAARPAGADVNGDGDLSPEEIELEKLRLQNRDKTHRYALTAGIALLVGFLMVTGAVNALHLDIPGFASFRVGGE